jgi:hypothetical protein
MRPEDIAPNLQDFWRNTPMRNRDHAMTYILYVVEDIVGHRAGVILLNEIDEELERDNLKRIGPDENRCRL